jgi:hypothetical protein
MGFLSSRVKRSSLLLPFLLNISSSFKTSFPKFSMSTFQSKNQLVIDAFAVRQFNNPNYTGTQVKYDIVEFENKVNEYFSTGKELIGGYAPFW